MRRRSRQGLGPSVGKVPENKLPRARLRRTVAHLILELGKRSERCEMVGSWRRGAAELGELDVLCIPKATTWHPRGHLPFASEPVNAVWLWLDDLRNNGGFYAVGSERRWLSKRGIGAAREIRGVLTRRGVALDLFLTTRDRWGCLKAIRTGPKDYSAGMVTYARELGMRFEGGRLWRGGQLLVTREERQVFEHLGLDYVEPEDRRRWRKPASALAGWGR